MASMLEVRDRHITTKRPPVLLAAGPVLLRPLGMAGIPAIVASSEGDDPTFASRYCGGRCILPPRSNQLRCSMRCLTPASDYRAVSAAVFL